jgi:hypothetical protein
LSTALQSKRSVLAQSQNPVSKKQKKNWFVQLADNSWQPTVSASFFVPAELLHEIESIQSS